MSAKPLSEATRRDLLDLARRALAAHFSGSPPPRLTSDRAEAFGEPRGSKAPAEASYIPMFPHLALVLGAGVYLPAPLVLWFQHVAQMLG